LKKKHKFYFQKAFSGAVYEKALELKKLIQIKRNISFSSFVKKFSIVSGAVLSLKVV